MSTIKELEQRIEKLEKRNKKVESNKTWETSYERKLIIAGLTYFVIVLFFYSANLPNPLVNAIVPTIGFLLSTLSLNIFKKILKY